MERRSMTCRGRDNTVWLPVKNLVILVVLMSVLFIVNATSTSKYEFQQKPIILPIKDTKLRKLWKRNEIELGNLFTVYAPPSAKGQPARKGLRGRKERTSGTFSPLILVGGLGGSALMSERHHAVNEPHWWCEKSADPFQVWMSLEELVPFFTEDCFFNDMSIHLQDGLLRQVDKGVKIYGKDIGGLSGVTSLLKEFPDKAPYLKPMTDYLIAHGGYTAGKSLRALTMDWRLGVKEWMNNNNTIGGDYFTLKALVEDTFKINGNQKVALMGHSMGGPFVQYFLSNFVNQQWKDQYIDSFIPFAGAFDGSPLAMILYLTGTNYGISMFQLQKAKEMVHQFASPFYMSPNRFPYNYPFFTYSPNNVTKQEYRSSVPEYQRYLADAKIKNAFELYEHEYSAYQFNKFSAPNVTTHCVYGYGIPTITHLEYTGPKELNNLNFDDLIKGSMRIINIEDGDGTVPSYSLGICDEFAKYQKQPVITHRFFNASHMSIVLEERVFEVLLNILNK